MTFGPASEQPAIDVDGKTLATPSSATAPILGRRTNGWSSFRVDRTAGRPVRDVMREYAATLQVGLDDDEVDENGDDDADA